MSESRLNIELFKAIREKIATTPESYDQGTWGRRNSSAPCGTAACIAGWACVLSDQASLEEARDFSGRGGIWRPGQFLDVSDIAREALGLDEEEADVLFTGSPEGEWYEGDDDDEEGEGEYYEGGGWPEQFAAQWREANFNHRAEASVAVAYLDHIISTGEVLE